MDEAEEFYKAYTEALAKVLKSEQFNTLMEYLRSTIADRIISDTTRYIQDCTNKRDDEITKIVKIILDMKEKKYEFLKYKNGTLYFRKDIYIPMKQYKICGKIYEYSGDTEMYIDGLLIDVSVQNGMVLSAFTYDAFHPNASEGIENVAGHDVHLLCLGDLHAIHYKDIQKLEEMYRIGGVDEGFNNEASDYIKDDMYYDCDDGGEVWYI